MRIPRWRSVCTNKLSEYHPESTARPTKDDIGHPFQSQTGPASVGRDYKLHEDEQNTNNVRLAARQGADQNDRAYPHGGHCGSGWLETGDGTSECDNAILSTRQGSGKDCGSRASCCASRPELRGVAASDNAFRSGSHAC